MSQQTEKVRKFPPNPPGDRGNPGNHPDAALEHGSKELSLRETLELLVRERKLVLSLLALFVLFTTVHHYIFPSYTSRTILLVQGSESSPLQALTSKISGMNFMYGQSKESVDRYLTFLKSHEFFLRASQTLIESPKYEDLRKELKISSPPVDSPDYESYREQVALTLKGRGSIQKDTQETLSISVSAENRRLASDVANLLIDQAVEQVRNEDLKELDQAKNYLVSQLDEISQRVKGIDSRVVDFKKEKNILSLTAAQEHFASQFSTLQKEIADSQMKLDENSRLIKEYSAELSLSEGQILTSEAKPLISGDAPNKIRQQIDSLRNKRATMLVQGMHEDAPQLIELDQELERLANALKQQGTASGSVESALALGQTVKQLKLENQILSTRIASLKKSLRTFQSEGKSAPENEQTIVNMQRKVDMEYSFFGELKRQLLQVEIQKISLENKLRAFQRATLAATKRSLGLAPKLMVVIGFGLLAGLVMVFLMEQIRPKIGGRYDLERRGVIVLGSIPNFAKLRKTFLERFMPKERRYLLSDCRFDPDSTEAMAFKHIRTGILNSSAKDDIVPQVIAVMSPGTGEGKSFTTLNLAASFAMTKERVIIVDCDSKRSSISTVFTRDKGPGLGDILNSENWQEKLVVRKDANSGVDILPVGKHLTGFTERICSEAFDILIEHLRTKYDRIFLDTPPMVAVVDPLIVAQRADFLLVVASWRETTCDDIDQIMEARRQLHNEKVFGVLNKVEKVAAADIQLHLPTTGLR